MMKTFELHSENPNKRDLSQIVERLNDGEILIFPTDTVYAIGCLMSNKSGIDRIIQITGKKEKIAKMSLICKDLKAVADHTLPYDNHVFKSMKRYLPGPYTFILNANNSVTKHFKNNKKEIGIRIPNVKMLLELLEMIDQPLVSTSLNNPDNPSGHFTNLDEIKEKYDHLADMLIESEGFENQESTVLDCTGEEIEIIREGKGEVD